MQRRKGNSPRFLPGAHNAYRRVQGDQGLREIAGIGGDAVVADAEYGVHAIDAVERRTAGTAAALVARRIRHVAEVGAARALENVASEARHVAQLRARREIERLRDHRKVVADVGVRGGVGHSHQRAKPQAVGGALDLAERGIAEAVDVDHGVRLHDVELHRIDEGGAAGEKGRLAVGGGLHRAGKRRDMVECEGPHVTSPSSGLWPG
jgi:hypothetical protein